MEADAQVDYDPNRKSWSVLDSIQICLASGMEFDNLVMWWFNTEQCFKQFPKSFDLTHFVFTKEWVVATSYQHVITTL